MSISDVSVVITLQKVIGRLGFGIPLILTGKAATAIPYTECEDIDEVKALYPTTTDVYKAAELLFRQEEVPAKIAVCSVTGAIVDELDGLMDKGWRQLLVASMGETGESSIKQIADYLEVRKDKMFFANIDDVTELSVFTNKDYDHTTVFYYPKSEDYPIPVAALVGATAGKPVGSITYKNQILKGLPALELDNTELQAIHTAGANTLVMKSGDIVTSEGKVLSGEFIDIVDSKDWLIQQITYKVQKTFNNYDKVSYDSTGINTLDGVVVTILKEAFDNGMIALGEDNLPTYWTDFATREETDQADRVVRKYVGGTFGFQLAGAIHTAEIKGIIEI